MSWLEQNKFLAGLIGVTAVGALGLGYVAISNGSELDALKLTLADKTGELQRVEGAKAFPNLENKIAIEANTKEYGETLSELQDKLLEYAPNTDSSVTVAEFQGLQNAYVDKLRVMFEGVKTPENCRFGFDEYASKMVPQRATNVLNYQLGALEVMFTELADISPEELINVYRPLSELELGDTKVASQGGNPRSRGSKRSKAAYQSLPIELGVKMEESKLMEFLERLANHKEYYFVVRLLRIKNERETSPNASELSFSKKGSPASGGGGGGSFFFDSDEEESPTDSGEPSLSTSRVLQQILGSEALDAHLKIDVLMFHPKEESALPTLN